MTGRVFRRSVSPNPPVAVSAHGSTIVDAEGREYLDAAGGAIVVNVGHGRREIADVIAEQAARLAYAHGTRVHDRAPRAVRGRDRAPPPRGGCRDLPCFRRVGGDRDRAQAGPVDPDRTRRDAALGGDRSLEQLPRQHPGSAGPVRAQARFAAPTNRGWGASTTSAPHTRTGAGEPGSQALGSTAGAGRRARTVRSRAAGPGTVAAFVAEPIVGATLGAVEPPDGYWPAIADVCRRHGVLLIADEVMTGFGRTGAWFAMDHYGVRPDLLVAAKGATSGYWPFGFVAASGDVVDEVAARRRVRPRVHLLATSRARRRSHARCCGSSRRSRWSRHRPSKGERLLALLRDRLGDHPPSATSAGAG